jgi:hypothetical protein
MQVKRKTLISILLLGLSNIAYSNEERILSGIGHDGDIYRSYSIEYFKWEENVDHQDRYFVKEDGFRANISYGRDNNRRQDSGQLESINNTFNIGYVDYSGGALSHGVDELKSKTVYLGKDANIGLGYRHFVNDNHSFDIKGFLGINLWNRAILNRTVYSKVEEKDVKVGAYEFFIEGYAKAITFLIVINSLLKSELTILYKPGSIQTTQTSYCIQNLILTSIHPLPIIMTSISSKPIIEMANMTHLT